LLRVFALGERISIQGEKLDAGLVAEAFAEFLSGVVEIGWLPKA